MRQQNLPYEEIYDALGFRVLVEDVRECYQALGIVHTHWTPIPGRFKDYIALPKGNMYQSLHTSVIGPGGERIEVQIRSHEMHRVAEEGIAAHWRYKEKGRPISSKDEQKFSWLKQLMEWQREVKDPSEFLDNVRVDLFNDEVFCFTPRGDVKAFPRGATPLDFAYAIHSHIGNRTVGAKINGAIVPLNRPMRNGDIVEIITRADAHPSQDWLDIVKTARAKHRIRGYIREAQRHRSTIVGREAIEKLLAKLPPKQRISYSKFQKLPRIGEIKKNYNVQRFDDLEVLVGYGKITAAALVNAVMPEIAAEQQAREAAEPPKKPTRKKKPSHGGIRVLGIDDVVVRFARCCTPVPGDDVVGYVTRGRGVTVHTRRCEKGKNIDPERRVACTWDKEAGATGSAAVKVRIHTGNLPGMLAALSQRFTDGSINIIEARCRVTDGLHAVNDFEIEVANLDQLNECIKRIQGLKGVTGVERL